MALLDPLCPAKCLLLAVSYATAANVAALHALTSARLDVFTPDLIFRLLLTFLPETTDPDTYHPLLQEVGSRVFLAQHADDDLDTSPIEDLADEQAVAQARKLHLRPLADAPELRHNVKDALTLFLVHRSRRIDSETGLLPLISRLVAPFVNRNHYLRDWFVSAILPLLRLDYEYHPSPATSTSLVEFESWQGADGLAKILRKALADSPPNSVPAPETIGRDFRGILGPWVHGTNQRQQRHLGYKPRGELFEDEIRKSVSRDDDSNAFRCTIEDCKRTFRTDSSWRQHVGRHHGHWLDQIENDPSIPVSPPPALHYSDHECSRDMAEWVTSWKVAFEWIVDSAIKDFALIVNVVDGWDGPRDINLGEFEHLEAYRRGDAEIELDLLRQYCQAAYASIYAVERNDARTIDGAHAILTRLAGLLGFEPPPDLATSIEQLPKIERRLDTLSKPPRDLLEYQALLCSDQPLTSPSQETFSLLQMFVYSSYQLSGLSHPMSVARVAKLRFWSDPADQMQTVQDILVGLAESGRHDEHAWAHVRDVLLWCWGWGISRSPLDDKEGFGIFGKIEEEALERQILTTYCNASQTRLAVALYLQGSEDKRPLPLHDVERIIFEAFIQHFDAAGNGNRTRGSMKKASDILNAVRPHLAKSDRFQKYAALMDATHALSFYSLTIEAGVPLRPSAMRATEDPLSLVERVMAQNPGAYTNLDDLISIGKKLAVSASSTRQDVAVHDDPESAEAKELAAEHRVTGMAIEAALARDDFETAYSYVVTRLTDRAHALKDGARRSRGNDVAWRAAYHAGKHPTSATPSSTAHASPQVRRLEQRMELLSQALGLAPPPALLEILAAWRRCEEELLTVMADEKAEERAFDDRADEGAVNVDVPGGFGAVGGPTFMVQPRRKEIGRGATEEAPMGLFEVARGAAAAFGRNAGALRGRPPAAGDQGVGDDGARGDEDGGPVDADGRVRKRDMVANAVTGSLASGIGWVLGAKPVDAEGR